MTSRRRTGLRLALAVCLAVGVVATDAVPPVRAATRYWDATFNVDVQRDIVYGSAVNVDGVAVTLTLDLYTPRNDTARVRPVLIWAHGGFFAFGSKDNETGWPTRMAQRGYVAASINYRLSSTLVTAPVDSPREIQAIDDARHDMQTVVRWFRAHAAELGIDPNRIAVGGVSAGAVTALGAALHYDDPGSGDHPTYSSAVCTAVSISGANDPLAADSGDAGAIFHHGSLDTIVPFEQAMLTRLAMQEHQLVVGWHEYPGEGHGFSAASNALIQSRTIEWLFERVATSAYPCSPSVGRLVKRDAQSTTPMHGTPGRSAVVSLVSVLADGPNYVQALACGGAPGGSSNVNADAPGQVRAGLAVVQFDGGGKVCLYTNQRSHLVADLQGYFAAGVFDDIVDQRILDTRSGARPTDGTRVRINGRPNSTAVASIVATDNASPGFLQVLACHAPSGASSNLNTDRVGQTRAALAFVPFDAQGEACVYTQRATHLVVDIQGYMTPGSFDDIADQRVLDTRPDHIVADGSHAIVRGRPGSTAVVSIVATETTNAGYVQVVPCVESVPPTSSNLNVDAADQTIANLAFVRFDNTGTLCVRVQSATHLVVDIQGYMAAGAFDDIADERLVETRA